MKIRNAVLTIGLVSFITTSYAADQPSGFGTDEAHKTGTWFGVKNCTGTANYAYTHIIQEQRKTYDNFRVRVTLSEGHKDTEWLNNNRTIPRVYVPAKVNAISDYIKVKDPEKLLDATFTDRIAAYVTCDYHNHSTEYNTPWVMGVLTLEINPQDVRQVEVEFKGLEEGEIKRIGTKPTEHALSALPILGWIINGKRQDKEASFDPYPTAE